MRKLFLPLALLLSACADTGPSGPVAFNKLYQGSLSGEPVLFVQAKDFDPAKPDHWQHVEEYSEWAVKDILGVGSAGSVYVVDTDQVPAPDGATISPELQQHTIAGTRWLPSQEADFKRDPFNTHASF